MDTTLLVLLIVGVTVVVSGIIAVLIRALARKKQLERELEAVRFKGAANSPDGGEAESDGSVFSERGTVPEIPEEFLPILAANQAVLYVGSQIGDAVGEPTLSELLRRLLRRVPKIAENELLGFNQSIATGVYEYAADFIRRRIPEDELRSTIVEIYGAGVDPRRQVPAVYAALAKLPFSSVLTSTWTSQLDEVFRQRSGLVVTPESQELEQVIRDSNRFFVLHLWGSPRPGTSLLFTAEERERALKENQIYAKFLNSLASSRSFLFLGAPLSEIEAFCGATDAASNQGHFAIVPRTALSGHWNLLAGRLRDKMKVRIITYVPTPGYPELARAVDDLQRRRVGRPGEPIAKAREQPRRLTAVRVTNIGPFKSLELKLNAGWNVILGNNACGKSTLLKAIALGLCGDDPEAAAPGARLLHVDAERGSVELHVGTEIFETKLRREIGAVRISSSGLTPLQRGRWVVLGFPPLRGISHRNPTGLSSPGSSEPHVRDLLPMLLGTVDSRLDDLKQWIVNAWSAPNGKSLLETFFSIIRDIAPSEKLTLKDVDAETWQVIVGTDDGDVPIEQVSQGMTSTIGWVGALLQRMYEIYPNSETPEKEPALVLVDEIDAHLHPSWQRALVGLVSKHFKGVQIVATTHSPLVITGMEASNVFVARRDPGERSAIEVVQASSEVDFRGMRADQILTSPLFGLNTTRGVREQEAIRRYSQLLGKVRTADEQKDFRELAQQFERWLLDGETVSERAIEMEKEKQAESELRVEKPFSPEERLRVDEGIDRIFGKTEDQK